MTKGRYEPQPEPLHRLAIGNGLTVRALETFITVARLGTMSAAAKQLGMTQSAVSQLVVQIEGALDVQLFDRKVRPPALTLQGAALLEPAQAVVSGIGRFQNALRWGPATQMPLLRIGMLNSFAETVGPVILARLRSVAAQLIVDTGFSATRARAVADREIDFVVTTDESPPPRGIQAVPLLTEPFLIVAPKSYKGDLQALKPRSTALDLIRYGRDPFMISRFDQTLRAWDIEPTHRYQMDTHAAILEMVAAGAGWTILPPLAVHRAVARGDKLRVAPYPEPAMKRTVLLISRTGEGAVLMSDIHSEATKVLQGAYLTNVRSFMPGVADMIELHEMTAVTAK
jgi:DNA-binding transcriptional LysR family regulator